MLNIAEVHCIIICTKSKSVRMQWGCANERYCICISTTGISFSDYKTMMKGRTDTPWYCCLCSLDKDMASLWVTIFLNTYTAQIMFSAYLVTHLWATSAIVLVRMYTCVRLCFYCTSHKYHSHKYRLLVDDDDDDDGETEGGDETAGEGPRMSTPLSSIARRLLPDPTPRPLCRWGFEPLLPPESTACWYFG